MAAVFCRVKIKVVLTCLAFGGAQTLKTVLLAFQTYSIGLVIPIKTGLNGTESAGLCTRGTLDAFP
jgi:hypothetical protein